MKTTTQLLDVSVGEPRMLPLGKAARLLGVSEDALVNLFTSDPARFPDDFVSYAPAISSNGNGNGHAQLNVPIGVTAAGLLMAAALLPNKRAAACSVALIRGAVWDRQLLQLITELSARPVGPQPLSAVWEALTRE
jgi:hypothetical protein